MWNSEKVRVFPQSVQFGKDLKNVARLFDVGKKVDKNKLIFFASGLFALVTLNLVFGWLSLFLMETQIPFLEISLGGLMLFSLLMADVLSPFVLFIPHYKSEFSEGKNCIGLK